MKTANKIDTLIFQMQTFAGANHVLTDMLNDIRIEYSMEEISAEVVKDRNRAQLNRVWHATRAFDTSLRMFLEKFGAMPPDAHSIGAYVIALQNRSSATTFKQLSGVTSQNIENEVTKKRNKYAHASNAIPTKGEANFIISKILQYTTEVYKLEI